MSSRLSSFRNEILASPFMAKRAAQNTGTSIGVVGELGLVNIGILTQAAGLICRSEIDIDAVSVRDRTMSGKLSEVVLPAATHVGSLKDFKSNLLMADIGGPLYTDCFKVLRQFLSSHVIPRLSNEEDQEKALIIDHEIAKHAATYLTSNEGRYLLQLPAKSTVGCPLRRMRYEDSGLTYFQMLVGQSVADYLDPQSTCFHLGYHGIASSIVAQTRSTERTDPQLISDPTEYWHKMYEFFGGEVWELNWELPPINQN